MSLTHFQRAEHAQRCLAQAQKIAADAEAILRENLHLLSEREVECFEATVVAAKAEAEGEDYDVVWQRALFDHACQAAPQPH